MNKAGGADGIPIELFQILRGCQQIWKTQQWPQDWKWSVFIPTPKNAQTTVQMPSSHKLVMFKILQATLQ